MAADNQKNPQTEDQPRKKLAASNKPKLKGYKRIKFKTWQPSAELDPSDFGSAKSKWRLNQKIKRTETCSDAASQDGNPTPRQLAARTAYSYRWPGPLQRLPLNGHRQDPFITLPIEATPDVTSALDFFLAACVPQNRNSEWLVGSPNPHMALLFPFMLKNAMLFEIIITLCRGSILLAQGKKALDDRVFLYRRAHAIKTITENLTTPKGMSDESLLSITMVLTVEYLTGNIAAVATHLDGIQQMLKFRDDLDGSTPWKRFVRAGVLAYQSLGCFVTGNPMQIPGTSPGYVKEAFHELGLNESTSYPGLPFSPDLCTTLSRLPSGLAEQCLSGNVSRQVMNFLAFAQATTHAVNSMEEIDERIDHEIQVMLAALQRLAFMETTTIEKFLISGLVAFAFQLRQLRSLNIFHDPPLRHLIDTMRKHEKPDSQRAHETMIWISISVAGALNLRTMSMPGSHEVLDRMFLLYPDSSNWSYVESILKTHFWTESIFQHWQKCWTLGHDRWTIVKRTLAQPEVRLIYPGSVTQNDEDDSTSIVSFEDAVNHIKGAGQSLAEMMEAAQRCPFQARFGASMQMSEMNGIGSGICPMKSIMVESDA